MVSIDLQTTEKNAFAGKLSDEALVNSAKQGDSDAFCELVERYHGTVLSVARARCGNYSTAEDIAQEAFLRAFLHLDKLKAANQFSAWLCRITHNLATDFYRKNGKLLFLTEKVCVSEMFREISDPRTSQPDAQLELEQSIEKAIQTLPVNQREIVLLHLGEKLSHKEIARRLNIHPSTVGRRYQKAAASMLKTIGAFFEKTISLPTKNGAKTICAVTALASLSEIAKTALAAKTAGVASTTVYTSTFGYLISQSAIGTHKMIFAKSTTAVLLVAMIAGGVLMNLRRTSVEDVYYDKDNPNGLSTTRMVIVWEDGSKLPICFDGRVDSETSGRIYAGWYYPEVRGTYDPYEDQEEYLVEKPPRLVEIDSEEEKRILAVVQYWLEGKVGPGLEKQFEKTDDFKEFATDHQILWHVFHSFHRYYKNSDREIPVVHDGESRVSDIHQYVDAGNHPGTVGFLLTTARGERYEICIDGRYATKTPGRIFVGGTYVTDANTKLVPVASQQEKEILESINSWLDLIELNELKAKSITSPTWSERQTLAIFRAVGQYEATYLEDDTKRVGAISAERLKPENKPKIIGIRRALDGGSILVDAINAEGEQIAFTFSYALRGRGGEKDNGQLVYQGKPIEIDSPEEAMLLEVCKQAVQQSLTEDEYRSIQDGDFNPENQEQQNLLVVYSQLQHYLKHFKNQRH